MLPLIIAAITSVLTVVGIGYYLLAIWSVREFKGRSLRPLPNFQPPVSILKPVRGVDREMYESFRSHCTQEYEGAYEVIFGVGSEDDPAVEAIERLKKEFPALAIRMVVCPKNLGANGKVSNLLQMLPYAANPYILINDSDIRVSSHYLRRVMACFRQAHHRDGRVGVVTTLYHGRAHTTIGSRMEALGISTDFITGVLTAQQLEGGLRFGLGATLAVSREALDSIGGLEPLVDYLADDYQLGARAAAAGYEVVLSPEVVQTYVPAYSFRQFLAHQIRWGRSTRDSRKVGYAGLALTYGVAWSILNLIATGASFTGVGLFCVALILRMALAALVAVGVLGDREAVQDWWLLIPRDLLALGLWAWSFAGDTVAWRGQHFTLKNGKLSRMVA